MCWERSGLWRDWSNRLAPGQVRTTLEDDCSCLDDFIDLPEAGAAFTY